MINLNQDLILTTLFNTFQPDLKISYMMFKTNPATLKNRKEIMTKRKFGIYSLK
jgi:hypothetical protein